MSDKMRKYVFYICVAISFVAIYVYNVLTPLMSDDFSIDTSAFHTVWDIIKSEYVNYMQWNGRSVLQFIMKCFLCGPKWLFNICNSVCFVFVTLLMYWNIDKKKKYDFILFTIINLMMWFFTVEFGQTVLWLSGACNYLWGSMIILSMVTLYRHKLVNQDGIKYSKLLAVGMLILGILSGWCNENTSGGGLLLVLFSFGVHYYQKRNIKPWMITGIAGMIIGLMFMVLAPGNSARGSWMSGEKEGLMRYLAQFLKINHAVYTYMFLMMVITIVILIYLHFKGMKLVQYYKSFIFMFAGIATAYALIMAPLDTMDRAYFGATIFTMISCVQAIAYIPENEAVLNTFKYAGCICFLAFMFFEYCENGANLMRIMREVQERDTYVEEQKAQGKMDLVVPMLREQFDNKYTFIYPNDVGEDPDCWGSHIYKEYYGLDSIRGVPREEWTEY